MNKTEHQELKTLHNKNRIKQIKKMLVASLERENQQQRQQRQDEDAKQIIPTPIHQKDGITPKINETHSRT